MTDGDAPALTAPEETDPQGADPDRPDQDRADPKVAHAIAPPPALIEFMSTGWAPQADQVGGPSPAAPFHARRRAALSARFPGQWLIVPAGGLKVRANDTDHRFRPGTDFAWLTGCHEPDSVLVLAPAGPDHRAVLYTAPRSDRSSAAFFTDRRRGELWVGPRPGLADVTRLLGLEACPADELAAVLKEAGQASYRVARGLDPTVDAALARSNRPVGAAAGAGPPAAVGAGAEEADPDAELLEALSELRLVKDDHEVASLERAVAATIRGFEDVVRSLPEAVTASERWVEGTFDRRARTEGNDVGYGTIAACGAHACTLHWVRNDGPVRAGDLLLLDAGVEAEDLYTADVTRTLPVSGHFDQVQREVYDVVWRAQQAGIEACRPGAPFMAPHQAAMRVIAEWLVEVGVLGCTLEEALDPAQRFHTRYTLHGTSHMLGMDVHDCAQARNGYRDHELAAGMVLTVEPGCYFQPDDLTVPERYRGIGVRIEDDVVITAEGHRVLTAALPSRSDEVEAWMAAVVATRPRPPA